MHPVSLSEAIRAEARRLGFARVGILPAGPSRTHAFYAAWLARGYGGEMAYLHRHAAPKADPGRWAEGVRSVICLAARYPGADAPPPEDGAPRGRISRYARARDYHDVLGERLRALAAFLEARAGRPVRHRIAVDSAPLMEREWAARAGLGWVGKNAMLIDWELGSYLFLAELLVDLELDYDAPEPPPRTDPPAALPEAPALPRIDLGLRESCGTCRACLDACPTGAIVADKTVDSRRCLSYLTIELKGPIPREHRAALGDWVFGCDLCQEVCPWNRHAEARVPPQGEGPPELAAPDGEAGHPRLADLLALDEAGFRARFRETALWRTRRRGLLRNAALALGNRLAEKAALSAEARREALAALARALADAEPVIRGAAAWALGRAGHPTALEALRRARAGERDPAVREEIAAALAEPAPASPVSPASPAVGAPDAR